MSKKIFFAILFFAATVFAIENGDTVYIDYDLQGGVNNPKNIAFYIYEANGAARPFGLFPPTREGYEFLGWYSTNSDNRLNDNIKKSAIASYDRPNQTSENKFQVYARWGVVSKRPQQDASGCMLVHDAAELYGAVKLTDSLMNKSEKACIFIENDIVVNKDLLAADGSPKNGEHFWWNPFKSFAGVIEGNGHTISGLYGNVGLIEKIYANQVAIQNLGIVDSYFSGDSQVGSFVAHFEGYGLALKNVYSTATVVGYGKDDNVGGLIGYLDAMGNACPEVDVLCAPPILRRAPSAYNFSYDYNVDASAVTVENAFFSGHIAGEIGGGLVGIADKVSFKNVFFAGTSDANDFSVIGRVMECTYNTPDDLSAENVFYLNSFNDAAFGAEAASAAEFRDGTILEKLANGSKLPVWAQKDGDAYPKLNTAFYNIFYRLNGGVNDSANPAYYVPNQEVALQPASKDGDVFEGWFADSNFTIPVDKIAATEEGNQRFFAKWESWYSVTYVNDGDYSLGSKKNPKCRYTDSATFTLEEPIRNGATFEGWFTDSTFTARVTELPQGNTENIVLIGKWNGPEIILRYDLHGGTMGDSVNPEKVVNGEEIYLKKPTREGYVFRGWYDAVHSKFYLDSAFTAYSPNNTEVHLSARWVFEAQKPAKDTFGCYMVTNVHELYFFDEFANSFLDEKPPIDACVNIMNDIVVNDEKSVMGPTYSIYEMIEWKPLNDYSNPFVGIIYGNGFTLSGLLINDIPKQPDIFNGLIKDIGREGRFPEVQGLYISNYYYKNEMHHEKLLINVKGGPVSIPKKRVPAQSKMNHVRKYDIKGRSSKARPHYGVYF